MKVKDIKMGIHTIELYAGNLKYHQIQRVIDQLVEQKAIQQIFSDSYSIDRHLKSTYLVDQGIRMRLYQSHDKSNGISFAINPATLLEGSYQPLSLYRPTKANVSELQEQLVSIMETIQLCDYNHSVYTLDESSLSQLDLSLSRMDLTADLYLDKSADIPSLIRLFRKSMIPRHYKRCELDGKHAHFFGFSTKKIFFKVYDKIYELAQDNRCPKKHRDKKILRLEVSVKREAFLKKLDLNRKDDLYTMLKAGYDNVYAAIHDFLDKLFPARGIHLPYPEAEKKIQKCRLDSDIKEQMLFLLKKTSRGAGLDIAAKKWKIHYKIVDSRKFHSIMKQFDQLCVNPVTLTSQENQEITCPCIIVQRMWMHEHLPRKTAASLV